MAEVTTIQEAAVLYRKVQERIDGKAKLFEDSVARDKHALEQLELIMLQMLKAQGTDKMNVPGVAEVKIVMKRVFGCGDWDLFYTWLVTQNKVELLQKRIHEGNMQGFIDEHGGDFLPPGVNVHTEAVIKLLKPK